MSKAGAGGTFLGVANADSAQFYSYGMPILSGTLSAHDYVIGTNDTEQLRLISGGAIQANVPVRLKGYTVATLPTGTVGDTAYVTDATAPTYLGALTGGGAVTTPVFYNGSAWVSH